jgi:hypothetical protein
MGEKATRIKSTRPVVSVWALRTASGKSQTPDGRSFLSRERLGIFSHNSTTTDVFCYNH